MGPILGNMRPRLILKWEKTHMSITYWKKQKLVSFDTETEYIMLIHGQLNRNL